MLPSSSEVFILSLLWDPTLLQVYYVHLHLVQLLAYPTYFAWLWVLLTLTDIHMMLIFIQDIPHDPPSLINTLRSRSGYDSSSNSKIEINPLSSCVPSPPPFTSPLKTTTFVLSLPLLVLPHWGFGFPQQAPLKLRAMILRDSWGKTWRETCLFISFSSPLATLPPLSHLPLWFHFMYHSDHPILLSFFSSFLFPHSLPFSLTLLTSILPLILPITPSQFTLTLSLPPSSLLHLYHHLLPFLVLFLYSPSLLSVPPHHHSISLSPNLFLLAPSQVLLFHGSHLSLLLQTITPSSSASSSVICASWAPPPPICFPLLYSFHFVFFWPYLQMI